MKNLFFVLIVVTFLSSNLLAQDKPVGQASLGQVQSLIDQNEAKAKQVESLESLYKRLSAEVVIADAVIDEILNPTNNRSRCIADCDDGSSVECSGDICVALDGIGCGSNSGGPNTIIICEDDVIATIN